MNIEKLSPKGNLPNNPRHTHLREESRDVDNRLQSAVRPILDLTHSHESLPPPLPLSSDAPVESLEQVSGKKRKQLSSAPNEAESAVHNAENQLEEVSNTPSRRRRRGLDLNPAQIIHTPRSRKQTTYFGDVVTFHDNDTRIASNSNGISQGNDDNDESHGAAAALLRMANSNVHAVEKGSVKRSHTQELIQAERVLFNLASTKEHVAQALQTLEEIIQDPQSDPESKGWAANYLGYAREHGLHGLSKEDHLIENYFKQAIEANYKEALTNLADFYYTRERWEEAKKILDQAVACGCATGQDFNQLGTLHEEGVVAVHSIDLAYANYEAGTRKGNAKATFNFARLLSEEKGCVRNSPEAARLFAMLGEDGDGVSFFHIAEMHARGDLNQGIPDPVSARAFYLKSINQGTRECEPRAYFKFAQMASKGEGGPYNPVDAFMYFDLASALGHQEAHLETGRIHLQGLHGNSANPIKSFEYFNLLESNEQLVEASKLLKSVFDEVTYNYAIKLMHKVLLAEIQTRQSFTDTSKTLFNTLYAEGIARINLNRVLHVRVESNSVPSFRLAYGALLEEVSRNCQRHAANEKNEVKKQLYLSQAKSLLDGVNKYRREPQPV